MASLGYIGFEMSVRPLWSMLSRKLDMQLWTLREKS